MKERKTILLLLAAAIVYRLAHYLVFSSKLVTGSDVMQNILLAQKFAAGNYYGVLDTYWAPLYGILVGVVTIFVPDLVLPAFIVSLIFSSLAVPVTYYLVKQSYGEREAIIAAVLAIFFPYLINSMFALGTENIYLVWITLALIAGWNALEKDRSRDYFLTGLLFGLAYLTRPEAAGYPVLFLLFIFASDLEKKRPINSRLFVRVGAVVLGFLILAGPYLVYLRTETGVWTISGKASVNIASGDLHDEHFDTDLDTTGVAKQTAKLLVSNFMLGMREVQKSLALLLPLLLTIFVGLGLFRSGWDRGRFKRETYLMTFCVFTACIYAATVVQDRYFYVLLPIFFGWIARGIVELEDWARKSLTGGETTRFSFLIRGSRFPVLCLMIIFFYFFTVNFYVRSAESAWQGSAFEERDAGQWLKQNGTPSPKIFSVSFRPAFYAGGEQVWTPETNFEEIMEHVRERKADYVIDNERTHKRASHLRGFHEWLQTQPDVTLVYEKTPHPGYRISIFKLN